MAEPIPGETGSSAPLAESIPNAEPIPGETHLQLPPQGSPSIPPSAFSPVPVPQHETRVAILGYHDFSRTLPATEMRMNTDTFRAQMQALKTAGVPIITMKDFLDWKLGDKQLPAKCVLITIDDGWKSVYTDAYPILREMKIPFTVFPYTKFITGRGSAMSREQIQEMLNNGATLGSHSVSHLYPRSWRAAQRKGTSGSGSGNGRIGNSRKILQEFPVLPWRLLLSWRLHPAGNDLKAEEAGFRRPLR
ncbi:MAG: polysaccharide deacetylase family protein [Akkermansia sp.]